MIYGATHQESLNLLLALAEQTDRWQHESSLQDVKEIFDRLRADSEMDGVGPERTWLSMLANIYIVPIDLEHEV